MALMNGRTDLTHSVLKGSIWAHIKISGRRSCTQLSAEYAHNEGWLSPIINRDLAWSQYLIGVKRSEIR